MKILVCGATGFIGRNIAQHFAQRPDTEVVGVYHNKPPFECAGISWIQADLTRVEDVSCVVRGVDVIVQAAATTSGSKDIVTRPHIHVTDNAVMNSLLFRAAHDHGVGHVIFFSCAIMYPSCASPQREADFDPNGGLDPRYFGAGWTKLYIEKMCEFYSGLGKTKYTAIRHSNIYGPHDKFDLERSHVFGATVTKVMTAEDSSIVVWGDGSEGRDLLYIDDLVDMVTRAIDRQAHAFGLYNVGAGEAFTVNELIERIITASGRDLAIEHDLSRPTIPVTVSLDCGLVREELGWKPMTSLESGICQTIDWWSKNIAETAPGLV